MKKINTLCAISLIISIIIGFINPYEQYISFVVNFWYIFSMFIYFINVKLTRRASKINGLNKAVDDYSNIIEGKGIKIFMVAALCLLKMFFLGIEIWLYSKKTTFGIKLFESATFIDNALLMLVLATIAEIIVVLTFSIRIWNEKREGVE